MIHKINKLILIALLGVVPAFAGIEDGDYDGDGVGDMAVYYAKKGEWYVRNSLSGSIKIQTYGARTAQPVPGDYDGDGKADMCLYEGHMGSWFLLGSQVGPTRSAGWGANEYEPMAGDFDGDGRNDFAVYHPPSGNWTILPSSGSARVTINWGWPEAEPVPGDYDGDGRTDCAVYQRTNGNWYIRFTDDGTTLIKNWGNSKMEPIQADYDGDGKTDLAVCDVKSGEWSILKSGGNKGWQFNVGWKDCQPVSGDYDGDGKVDPAVYQRTKGNWRWLSSVDGNIHIQQHGWDTSEPAPSAYRVEDDATYCGNKYDHDYDNDAFSKNGLYPRTGEKPAVVVEPPPSGGGTEPGPANPNAIKPSEVKWLTSRGPGFSKAKTIMKLQNVRISGNRCFFTTSPKIPWAASGAKGVNGMGFLIRKINGKYVGGKCEWLVGPRGWYDIKTNVRGGYNGHTMPVSGETVWVGIGNRTGSQVSELVPARWP